jgi:outer membrane protein assembly factor BamB
MNPKAILVSCVSLALCLAIFLAVRRARTKSADEDPNSPHILWSYNASPDAISGIALSTSGTIHFAARDGVYALSPEGKLLWKVASPVGLVVAAPALSPNGTLYAASESGKLFALDSSGHVTWQSAGIEHKFFTPPALGNDNAIYVADDYTDLFSFAPTMGVDPIWRQRTYSPTGPREDVLLGSDAPGYTWFRSSPVIDASDMIFLPHQQWLYRLNLNGDVIWFLQTLSTQLSFPAIGGDGTVYLEGHNPLWVFAIGADGKQRWAVRPSNRVHGSPVVDTAGIIYFCDSDFIKAITPEGQSKWNLASKCDSGPALATDGTLYLGTIAQEVRGNPLMDYLSAITPDGQLKWKLQIRGMVRDAPAIAADGIIYFTTDQGYAYAVSDAGSPPMQSPWPRFQHDAQNSGRAGF